MDIPWVWISSWSFSVGQMALYMHGYATRQDTGCPLGTGIGAYEFSRDSKPKIVAAISG